MSSSHYPPEYSTVEQMNRSVTRRVYGIDQRPAKFDLIREEPRKNVEQPTATINMNPIQFDASQNMAGNQNARTSSRSQQNSTVYYAPSLAQTPLSRSANQSRSTSSVDAHEPPQGRYLNVNITQQQQSNNDYGLPDLDSLANELAQKEAKLRREIAYMNTYKNRFQPKSTWDARREPDAQSATRAKSQRVWHKEVPQSPLGSRPASRASSARSATTEADVLEKAARLLEDAEEMERKEIIDELVVLDPKGEQRPAGARNSPAGSLGRRGVKSAIINVPSRDIDNKSPLPFSYDNFSTLGVRGNIASVGAAIPDKPYPPIFPQLKRTQSPLM